MEITGRLEGWYYDYLNNVVWGYIYDDTRGRFVDGQRIHTSDIPSTRRNDKDVSQFVEGSVISTRNSRYLLGKPLTNAEK